MEITLEMRFAVPKGYYFCPGCAPSHSAELRWTKGISNMVGEYPDGYYCKYCLLVFQDKGSEHCVGPLLSEVLPKYPFTKDARAKATLERIDKWQEENPEAAAHPVWEDIMYQSMSDEGYAALYGGEAEDAERIYLDRIRERDGMSEEEFKRLYEGDPIPADDEFVSEAGFEQIERRALDMLEDSTTTAIAARIEANARREGGQ